MQDACLELVCPFYEVKVGNRCMSVIKQLTGVTLQFQINFIVDMKNQTLPSESFFIAKAKYIILTVVNGTDRGMCDLAVTNVTEKGDSQVISLYVASRLARPANILDIYEQFQTILVLFNNKQDSSGYIFKAESKESDIAEFGPNNSYFIAFQTNRTNHCSKLVAISKRQVCRRVVFDRYIRLDLDVIVVDDILFNGAEFFYFNKGNVTQPSVAICEDTYVNKILTKKGINLFDGGKSNGDQNKSNCTRCTVFVLFCASLSYVNI